MESLMSCNDEIKRIRGLCCDEHASEARSRDMRNSASIRAVAGSSSRPAHLETRDVPTDAQLLGRARSLGLVPSTRSDALAAELATAKTKSERRDAVARFMEGQRDPSDARFTSFLQASGHEWVNEERAAAEGTGSAGGFIVPPRFSDLVIHFMREHDGLLRAFEQWESLDGEIAHRPGYSEFTAAATDTENAAFTEGPYPVFSDQAWPLAPTYAASFIASWALIQDSFREITVLPAGWDPMSGDPMPASSTMPDHRLDQLVASGLGESLSRALAPVAQSAVYAAISTQGAVSDSGGFIQLAASDSVTFASGATSGLVANTVSVDLAAQMIASVDESYLNGGNCKFYLSRKQWSGILRQVDGQKLPLRAVSASAQTLHGYPVVLTSQASPLVASTLSGPIFGDLQAGYTLRTVQGSFFLLRSSEARAEFGEMFYRCALRADVKSRDPRAVVGVKPFTT